MEIDETPEPEPEVNLANAVDLSESEDEEELEDIIDDFAVAQQNMEEDVRMLYPEPPMLLTYELCRTRTSDKSVSTSSNSPPLSPLSSHLPHRRKPLSENNRQRPIQRILPANGKSPSPPTQNLPPPTQFPTASRPTASKKSTVSSGSSRYTRAALSRCASRTASSWTWVSSLSVPCEP